MSKKTRILISCILVVFAFCAGIATYIHSYGNRTEIANADGTTDFFVDAAGKIKVPVEPKAGETITAAEKEANRLTRGTEGNPFFILEITPYEGYAQFGYHIAGCEPVDIDRMLWDGKSTGDIYGASTFYEVVSEDATRYYWEKDFPAGYSGGTVEKINQYGTMTLVTDNSGNYKRIGDDEIYETAPDGYEGTKYVHDAGTDTYIEDKNGTFLRRIVGKYEPATDGDYKWVPMSVEENLEAVKDAAIVEEYEKSSHEGDEFKAYFPDVKYIYKGYLKEIVHKNEFLRESVGLAYEMKDGKRVAITDEDEIQKKIDAFKVVVYTVTPEDLNMNLELIDRADMISFALKDSTEAALNAYKNGYGKPEYFSHDESTDLGKRVKNVEGATFATNVLDWSTVVAIYERVNNTTKVCPVLFNTHIFTDIKGDNEKEVELKANLATGEEITKKEKGTQNNLYKLFLMLYQMPTSTFESLYKHPSTFGSENIKTGLKNKDGSVIKTGKANIAKYSPEANTYWSEFTFIPWGALPSSDPNTYTPILDSLEILSNAGTVYHFAAGDAQNYLMHNFLLCNGGTQFSTGFMSDSGLEDNVYGHEVFEFFENIGVDKDNYTTAECLYYLLHGLTADRARNSDKYKILELQPSNSMLSEAFWQVFVSTYAKTDVKPDVDQMTTAEFIGKNVDVLAEYDLVYIGMNKRSGDVTLHDDFTYAHTGPTVNIDQKYTVLHSWLPSASKAVQSTLAYSGNDLTLLTKTHLMEFANSGAALVFGNGFFTSAKADKVAAVIDVNSHVYKLQEETTNRLYEGALSDATYHLTAKAALQTALAKGRRVEMVVHSSPNIYEEGKSDKDKYINGTSNDKRTLSFKFTLNAPGGNKYKAVLYTDINGDGKFTSDENIGVTVRESGGGSVYELVGGKTYEVTRVVLDRIGSLSWKLDIVKDGVVYDSISGVSAIKAKTDKSEDIKLNILQIIPEQRPLGVPESEPLCTVYLPETDDAGNLLNNLPDDAEPYMKEVTKKFYDWTRNINGMDIKFVRMTQTEVETAINSNAKYLTNTYDMIIIGFADVYEGITLQTVRDKIVDFIGSGRAVLFTHDTASLAGPAGEGGYSAGNMQWGEIYTKAFRDIFAMDRYDVIAHGGSTGVTRGDYPYLTSSDAEHDIGKLLTRDSHVLAQGFTNGIIQRYKLINDNLNAKKVTQVNTGAITEYPYTLEETIDVALTHTQYYQLDMERSDIVVWYCLDGTGYDANKDEAKSYYESTPNDVRNNYYIYNAGNITYSGVGHNGELSDDEIKLFINTFVAAYRAMARPAQVIIENDDATKLAGSEKYYLCVDVSNSDATKALKTGDIVDGYYLQSGDSESGYTLSEENTQQSKRVYFKIVNNSAYGNVEFDLKFYLNVDAASEPDPLPAETPLAVFRSSDNKFMDMKTPSTKIEQSVEYYVDVPIRLEEKVSVSGTTKAIGTTELDISVVMTYGTERLKTDPLYTEADILPRGMFDLD